MLAHTRILQLDVLGSFDFYTQIVSIDAVESTQFEELMREMARDDPKRPLSLEKFQAREAVLPLLAHELAHFVDATATLWGMRHLSLLDAAYSAMVREEEPYFYSLKTLHDHVRLLRLPQYYTTQGPSRNAAQPWRYQVSLGRPFSATGHLNMATSITFCRFQSVQGDLIVRSPLSPISLLEASAMAQETAIRAALVRRLDAEAAIVESADFSRRTLQYLYNRDLTEYSVCAHLVANHQQASDALLTFFLSGTIARWVLNAPTRAFERIANRAPLGRIVGAAEDDPYVTALRDGIRSEDLGALYYTIVAALPEGAWRQGAAVKPALDASLAALALEPDTVARWRQEDMTALAARVATSACASLRLLAAAGLSNQGRMTPYDVALPFAKLDLPQVLFGDVQYRHAVGNPALSLAQVDPEVAFEQLHRLERYVANFAEACV